eukprot:CAMPEP_0174763084 /NCGR_PEP_ID=MMETSP1094-20130205/110104_1 /TAXON_ID=156173 /ORGANISM="Chrysochromulina brevifilum, Strain UTEX LB 985" /LENGTH=78 /DNA_ID=CAMNT_0015969041 /DNA_START=654 /DNA_END=893 /DNA_ORIENTATION=-
MFTSNAVRFALVPNPPAPDLTDTLNDFLLAIAPLACASYDPGAGPALALTSLSCLDLEAKAAEGPETSEAFVNAPPPT